MKKFIIGIFFLCFLFVSCHKKAQESYDVNDDNCVEIVTPNGHKLLRINHYSYKSTEKYNYVHSVNCNCGNVSSVDSALYYMYNNYPNSYYK